jgi:hypothetical protein
LEIYLEYFKVINTHIAIASRVIAARKLGDTGEPIDIPDGLRLLADAEQARNVASDKVRLIGDTKTVASAGSLTKEIWRLEWIARGLLTPTESQFRECNNSIVLAVNSVQSHVREELGIPGDFLPRGTHPEFYIPTLPQLGD